MIELLQEKIAHLETQRQLWQVQGQLLHMLGERSAAQMDDLTGKLREAQGKQAGAEAPVA